MRLFVSMTNKELLKGLELISELVVNEVAAREIGMSKQVAEDLVYKSLAYCKQVTKSNLNEEVRR